MAKPIISDLALRTRFSVSNKELDVRYKRRLWPRASSLIVEETLKKRISNNEYRMSK